MNRFGLVAGLVVLLAGGMFAQDDANSATSTVEARGLRFESEHFSIRLRNQVQFRLTFQDERAQSGQGGSNGRDFANFNIPRAKLGLRGHIFDNSFQYHVRVNWTRTATEILEVAHFRWALAPAVNFNAGQDKMPWNWEEQVDSGILAFQERTYANEVFNQDYAKGIWIDGRIGNDAPWVKYWLGVYNGVLAAQDDFRNKDGAVTSDNFSAVIDGDILVNLRLETHPLGEVAQGMRDLRSEEEHDEILFAFGLGANWFASALNNADLRGDTAAQATGSGRSRIRQETYAVTLDGHFRFLGISVDAAVYWRYTDFHNTGINEFDAGSRNAPGDLEDFGWSFEAAYFIHMIDLSVGVRASSLDADEFWGANAALQSTTTRQRAIRPDAMEYGITASYYLHGERLKFSMDILYVDQQLAYPYDGSATLLGVYNDPLSRRGAIGSNPDNDDHDVIWIVRMQVQWIF